MTDRNRARSAEALEFAPGLLAIQESPPPRLPRAVLYSVAALLGLLILWATFGELDIIVSADGKLVPKNYIKIVQPADAGIVKEIRVHEGEHVVAGQVLLRMDSHDAEADLHTLQTELALRSLQLRRVDAELTNSPLRRQPTDLADLFAQVSAQLRDRHQAYLDSRAQAQEELKKARHDFESARSVLAKLAETNPILEKQARAYADLGKDGYAPEVVVGDKQRAYLENARDLEAQQSTVAALAASVAGASNQVEALEAKYRSDLRNERVDAEAQYRKLQDDWSKQARKSELLELRAPTAGIVKDLATHTVGTVVSAGTMLLSLVPEREPLVAEVMIRNDDIGFVRVGQKVKVKLVAYPFQKYGMLDGEVTQLWPDASDEPRTSNQPRDTGIDTQQSSASSSGFKAIVAIDRQVLQARSDSLALTPGMAIVAEVREGRRTVLEYLLSPIQKTIHEGGRER
jgi:hemolysin D